MIPPLSLGALTEAEGRGEGSLSYFLLQASSLTVIQNSDADRSMPLRSEDKSAGNLTNAQRLRRESSPAERVLWGSLRARRLGGPQKLFSERRTNVSTKLDRHSL